MTFKNSLKQSFLYKVSSQLPVVKREMDSLLLCSGLVQIYEKLERNGNSITKACMYMFLN